MIELWLRGLAALVLAGSSGALGLALATRWLPGAPLTTWATAGLVSTLWSLQVVFHLLLQLEVFTLQAALVTWLVLAGAALRIAPREEVTGRLRRLAAAAARWVADRRAGPEGSLVLGAGILLAFSLVRGLLTPPLAWDSLTYHLVLSGGWVQTGAASTLVAPDAWEYYQYLPAAGDVIAAWVLLPFHGDLLVNLAHYPAWLLLLLAFHGLGRELGLEDREAGLGALAVGFAPAFFSYLNTAYVEIQMTGALAAATLLTARWLRRSEPGAALLAGMAVGLAAGTKVLAGPVVGVLVVGLVIGARGRGGRGARAVACAAALAALAATPWYLRAWRDHGNPLYPMPLKVAGVTLSEGHPNLHSYFRDPGAYKGVGSPSGLDRLAGALAMFGLDATDFGPLLGVGLLLAPLGLRRARGSGSVRLLVGAAALPLVALFVGVYFTSALLGTQVDWVETNARFFAFSFGLATMLALPATQGDAGGARLARGALGIAAAFELAAAVPAGFPLGLRTEILRLGVLAFLLASVFATRSEAPGDQGRPLPTSRFLLAGGLLFVTLLPGLEALRARLRRDLHASAFEVHTYPQFADAWDAVEREEAPRRVAVAAGSGGHNWFWAPFMGSHLQHRLDYVPVTTDGSLVSYRDDATVRARADRRAWLERLLERQVDLIVLLPSPSIEVAWTAASPQLFPLVAAGGKLPEELFRIHRVDRAALRARR